MFDKPFTPSEEFLMARTAASRLLQPLGILSDEPLERVSLCKALAQYSVTELMRLAYDYLRAISELRRGEGQRQYPKVYRPFFSCFWVLILRFPSVGFSITMIQPNVYV